MTPSGTVASRQTQRYDSVTGLSLLWKRFRYTQLFLRAHIETLSVPVTRLSNPTLHVRWSQSLKEQRKPNQPAEIPVGDSLILREILGSTRLASARTYRKLVPAQARKPARLTGKMPVLQSRRGGIGRRAGLKIQPST